MLYGIDHDKGFTLLEIMVAMAIMATALVTIIQLLSGALRSAKISYDYTLGVMGAKEKMDQALAVTTMEEFEELIKTGEFDSALMEGYRWEISEPEPYILPEGLSTDIEEESGPLEDQTSHPYQITVTVRWASGLHDREVSFTSIKILEEEE
ncbi:MAG: type IV pilus modification PilV family protein [bacterium]